MQIIYAFAKCPFIFLSFLEFIVFYFSDVGLNISLHSVLFNVNVLVYLVFYYLVLCHDATHVLNE